MFVLDLDLEVLEYVLVLNIVFAWSMDDPQVRWRAVWPSISFIVTSG